MLRTVLASGVLAILLSAAFAVLFVSIANMRDAAGLARHSQTVLSVANRLERLVVDLETGERGFLITGDERLLAPWEAARRAIPGVSAELLALTRVPAQHRRARRIESAVGSYVRDYSVPLVRAERRDRTAVRGTAVIEGKRRIDTIRADFNSLVAAERRLAESRQDRSVTSARRATIAAVVGLGGSVLFVALFVVYLSRAILRPVRRAASMADRLAHGDLTVHMPETGPGEIGELERSFNTMTRSLRESRDELHVLAEEQAALRRVATLVARRASAAEVFDAVVDEVGGLLGAPATRLLRYRADGTAAVVAGRSDPGVPVVIGTMVSTKDDNIAARVLQSGHAARIESAEGTAIGAPIAVERRLWGVMIGAWTRGPPRADTETRMAQFTELVATAIANAESRAELTASRARVVAAADETRRRIERDLHDGTQQRLVAAALALRGAEAAVPAELGELRDRLDQAAQRISGAVDELQEISRGIHPAILSRGGLKPALRNLARRSGIPVELDVDAVRRLPAPVEVAAYYVVSEALTNAAKYAQASLVRVGVEADDAALRMAIRDDGVGGADPVRGSGLVGLRDRVEALGGQLDVESPVGGGTTLVVVIPLAGPSAAV
jgi:signal transduction histidine kinase